MRLIKVFLAGIIGLFIFSTLLSLLIPAHPKVSRTVVINTAAKEKVIQQIKNFDNWKNWQPLFASESAKVISGKTQEGEGAECSVEYNNKITHLSITKSDSSAINFIVKAEGENEISNQIIISSLQPSQQIRVDWIATAHLHWYPWEKFYAIFIDKLSGPGYETSLNNLKQFVESH